MRENTPGSQRGRRSRSRRSESSDPKRIIGFVLFRRWRDGSTSPVHVLVRRRLQSIIKKTRACMHRSTRRRGKKHASKCKSRSLLAILLDLLLLPLLGCFVYKAYGVGVGRIYESQLAIACSSNGGASNEPLSLSSFLSHLGILISVFNWLLQFANSRQMYKLILVLLPWKLNQRTVFEFSSIGHLFKGFFFLSLFLSLLEWISFIFLRLFFVQTLLYQ